ncbi:glycosyltransferase [Actinomadura sp. HBU206391]|uniref:glycosyltransferase n=1 Tax=Actinomadura sp. HBU206391 TaxID=2731692 RepID=UPI0016501259|nr:glycosyltransferase [Actinomadura sp. HBU206391]MBC6461040.1 glycosyltransferase [Actinomadura sp. HBU206391]
MNGYIPDGAPVRVAHFSDTFLPRRDGIVTALRTMINTLDHGGHPGLLVVPRFPARPPCEEVGLALPSVSLGVAGLRFCRPRLRHVHTVARWSPQLVHVHTSGSVGLLGVLTARELGLPSVVTYHTDLHAYADAYRIPTGVLRLTMRYYAGRLSVAAQVPRHRRAVIDAINSLMFGAADTIIVPTEAILRRAPLPLPHDRVVVLPSGVAHVTTPPDAGPRFRARWKIPVEAPLVLFVGRVHHEKGVDLLVHAFRTVLDAHPEARLALVGALYRPRWLRGLLASAGIAHRTVITGQQAAPEVADAYAAAQVFAFPSRTDTQGLVLHEAALAGLPSVVVDAALHATSPMRTAMILARPAPGDLGAAVSELLSEPHTARRLGAAAREVAAAMNPQHHGEQMLEIYRAARRRAFRDPRGLQPAGPDASRSMP